MNTERWSVEFGGPRGTSSMRLEMAVRIVDRWRDSIPTDKQLMDGYGMSRAAAYRWIRALKDGRGLQ